MIDADPDGLGVFISQQLASHCYGVAIDKEFCAGQIAISAQAKLCEKKLTLGNQERTILHFIIGMMKVTNDHYIG